MSFKKKYKEHLRKGTLDDKLKSYDTGKINTDIERFLEQRKQKFILPKKITNPELRSSSSEGSSSATPSL